MFVFGTAKEKELPRDIISQMKWFFFYTYFFLPSLVIKSMLIPKTSTVLEYVVVFLFCSLFVSVILGLHKRRIWAWKLNWFVLLLISSVSARANGVPYLIGLLVFGYLWFFPNYIYFRKRKCLFAKINKTGEKIKA